MLLSTIYNYLFYIKKLIKIFLIILLSIFIFYCVFQLVINFPSQSMEFEAYTSFVDDVREYLSTIDTSNIFNTGFLTDVVIDVLHIIEADANISLSDFKLTQSTILIVCSLLFIIASFGFAIYDCKKVMREDYKDIYTIARFFQIIFRGFLSVLVWIAILVVTFFWLWAIFILPVLLAIFQAYRSLLSTWLIYFKRFNIRRIVNLKYAIRLAIVNVIIMYAHTAAIIALYQFVNVYVILLVSFSFFAYILCITEFTATKYFTNKHESLDLI